MKRRSAALSAFVPVLTLAVIGGFVLNISDRPWPLLVPAFIGCVLVLLGLLYRERLGRLARRVLGGRAIEGLQSGKVLGGLFFAVVFGLLVWWLWPGSRLWVGYMTLGLAAVLFGCGALRLHPAASPAPPEGEWVHPVRWMLGGLSVFSMSVLTELAPGDLVHGVGGGSDMGTSEVLAIAVGIKKVVREEGEATRETVRDEGEATREEIADDGQRTRDEVQGVKGEIGAKLDAQSELLTRALALLEAKESFTPSLSPGSDAVPERPPLSDEDKAIFEAAKPSADALTRYRIAVAEGNDDEAGRLEPEVERLLVERRADEDFLFAQAKGDRHFYAGRYDEAIPAYREALLARPDEAGVLNTLALALQRSRHSKDHGASLREAEGLLARALELRRTQHPGDHPDVASSLNNLAAVWDTLGRAAEAEPLYLEALEMRRRLFEGDHPAVALSLNNLAYVREALGRAAEAEPMYIEALEMRQRLFKGDHPDVAQSLNNLAYVREALGRAGEAEPLYVEALEMRQRLFEGDHPDVAMSLKNLAANQAKLGRWAEALGPSEQAVAMAARCLPVGHPHRVIYEKVLAWIQENLDGG